VWALIEIVVSVLQLLSLLPQNPKAPPREAPNWVRWPIYGVIVLATLMLVFAWVLILLV
jgi:hypothetical protein